MILLKEDKVKKEKRCPERMKHVVWRTVSGKGVLLSIQDGSYYEVNPVGLAVWERCDGRTPPEEIARWVAKRFSSTEARVGRDVRSFLQQLKRRELVRYSCARRRIRHRFRRAGGVG